RPFPPQTRAPSSENRPQEATAQGSPQLMSASEREGERNRSGASPASARRRLRARTGPCLTAKTPDFGLASPTTVATSPAANISGHECDCRVSRTATKPRASVARRLVPPHEGAY